MLRQPEKTQSEKCLHRKFPKKPSYDANIAASLTPFIVSIGTAREMIKGRFHIATAPMQETKLEEALDRR